MIFSEAAPSITHVYHSVKHTTMETGHRGEAATCCLMASPEVDQKVFDSELVYFHERNSHTN